MSDFQITGMNGVSGKTDATQPSDTNEAEAITIQFPTSSKTLKTKTHTFDSNAYFNIQTEEQPKTDKKKEKEK